MHHPLALALSILIMIGAGVGAVRADMSLSGGVAYDGEASPFLKAGADWNRQVGAWKLQMDAAGTTENQSDFAPGDSTANLDLHAETPLSQVLRLELDAAYALDREVRIATEHTHDLSFDVGVLVDLNAVSLKLDAGVFAAFHGQRRFEDARDFSRRHEDYLEREIAARLTANLESGPQPFIELAYMRRSYAHAGIRGFEGPDVVMGLTFDGSHFSGDAGVILAFRDADFGSTSQVFGPYLDVTWRPSDRLSMKAAASAGLDQETSGNVEVFPYYGATIELAYQPRESWEITTVAEAAYEKHASGDTLEITPELEIRHEITENAAIFAAASITYEWERGESEDLSSDAKVGLTLEW